MYNRRNQSHLCPGAPTYRFSLSVFRSRGVHRSLFKIEHAHHQTFLLCCKCPPSHFSVGLGVGIYICTHAPTRPISRPLLAQSVLMVGTMLGMMGACVETYQYDGRRPTRLSWKTRFYADFWSVKNKRTPSASSSNPVLIAKVAACFVGVLAPGFRERAFLIILFYFIFTKPRQRWLASDWVHSGWSF